MKWSDYLVIAWLTLGTLMMIAQVGKKREPIEPGAAVLAVIITAGLILSLVLTHT